MTSHWKSRLTVLSVALFCSTAGTSDLRADPLAFEGTWYLVNSSPVRLDLFSNPGVVLEPQSYGGTIFPHALLFGALVTHEGGESFTDTIRFTYDELGAPPVVWSQTFTTGVDPIQLGFAVGFEPILRTGTPVPTTLRVELLDSDPDFVIPGGPNQGQLVDSYTYSFNTLAPVPEPSTLVLLITGGAAALSRRGRRFLGMTDRSGDPG
jgi:hypothetical protein